MSARGVLERGARKRIGDGRTVDIWKDRWLPVGGSGMVVSPKPANCPVQMVHELIQDGKWNKVVMESMFREEDCKKIEGIPISLCGGKDKLVWPWAKSGQDSVKTGYMLARDMRRDGRRREPQEASNSRNACHSNVWKVLWNLDIKHKLKHFVWKCL